MDPGRRRSSPPPRDGGVGRGRSGASHRHGGFRGEDRRPGPCGPGPGHRCARRRPQRRHLRLTRGRLAAALPEGGAEDSRDARGGDPARRPAPPAPPPHGRRDRPRRGPCGARGTGVPLGGPVGVTCAGAGPARRPRCPRGAQGLRGPPGRGSGRSARAAGPDGAARRIAGAREVAVADVEATTRTSGPRGSRCAVEADGVPPRGEVGEGDAGSGPGHRRGRPPGEGSARGPTRPARRRRPGRGATAPLPDAPRVPPDPTWPRAVPMALPPRHRRSPASPRRPPSHRSGQVPREPARAGARPQPSRARRWARSDAGRSSGPMAPRASGRWSTAPVAAGWGSGGPAAVRPGPPWALRPGAGRADGRRARAGPCPAFPGAPPAPGGQGLLSPGREGPWSRPRPIAAAPAASARRRARWRTATRQVRPLGAQPRRVAPRRSGGAGPVARGRRRGAPRQARPIGAPEGQPGGRDGPGSGLPVSGGSPTQGSRGMSATARRGRSGRRGGRSPGVAGGCRRVPRGTPGPQGDRSPVPVRPRRTVPAAQPWGGDGPAPHARGQVRACPPCASERAGPHLRPPRRGPATPRTLGEAVTPSSPARGWHRPARRTPVELSGCVGALVGPGSVGAGRLPSHGVCRGRCRPASPRTRGGAPRPAAGPRAVGAAGVHEAAVPPVAGGPGTRCCARGLHPASRRVAADPSTIGACVHLRAGRGARPQPRTGRGVRRRPGVAPAPPAGRRPVRRRPVAPRPDGGSLGTAGGRRARRPLEGSTWNTARGPCMSRVLPRGCGGACDL